MRLTKFSKKILAYVCAAALTVTSFAVPVWADKESGTVTADPLVLDGGEEGVSTMIKHFDAPTERNKPTDKYKYLGWCSFLDQVPDDLTATTGNYRYLVMTYTGDITQLRFEFTRAGVAGDGSDDEKQGPFWFNPEGQTHYFVTADGSDIPLIGDNTTIVIDLAESVNPDAIDETGKGVEIDWYNSGIHMHCDEMVIHGNGAGFDITDAYLTKELPVPPVESTTEEDTTVESTTEEAGTVEPTTVEDGTVEPTTVEDGTVEPTTVEDGTVEPTTVESTTVEPTTVEPTTVESTTVEPTTVEPQTTVEPTTVEPQTTVEPTTVEPTTVEPVATGVGIDWYNSGIHMHCDEMVAHGGGKGFDITNAYLSTNPIPGGTIDDGALPNIILDGGEEGISKMIGHFDAPTARGKATNAYKYLGWCSFLDSVPDKTIEEGNYRYLIMTYTGDITQLRFEFCKAGPTGDGSDDEKEGPFWFNPEGQTYYFVTADGSPIPLIGDDTTIVIDLAKTVNPNAVPIQPETKEKPTNVQPVTKAPETTKAPKLKKATIKKVYTKKKASKKLKVQIKKFAGAKTYKVQVSKKNSFKKKNILFSKYTKKVTKTFTSKKFKNKKKLYVRVMAYKYVGKKKVAISKWSKAKKVKIKK
jgi:hypothetical protein